jgi:hypothetical protein
LPGFARNNYKGGVESNYRKEKERRCFCCFQGKYIIANKSLMGLIHGMMMMMITGAII